MYLTLGAVTGQMVKLENVGSTALFYRWERRPLESMGVTTPRRTLGWLSLDLHLHYMRLHFDLHYYDPSIRTFRFK